MQQRFEFMCRNRKEALTIHLHRAHGHPNNRTLLLNLEAAGLPYKHLKRYILAMSCDAGTMALYDDLAIHNTLAIAKAFLQHSVKFVTPHYRPDVMGEMRVIGVDTKKLTKTKAVLIVKFLTPQSLKDSTMHMYCTSLEPKRAQTQEKKRKKRKAENMARHG